MYILLIFEFQKISSAFKFGNQTAPQRFFFFFLILQFQIIHTQE